MSDQQGLRVLIVDDERPARRKVRRFVEEDPEVAAVFEAPDGRSALEVIREWEPDLVFLDVRMPGMSGLDLLEALAPERAPRCVLVTAHDEYAVQAFELAAVDYLLKPFDADRFGVAFQRAKEAARTRDAREDLERVRRLLAELTQAAPSAGPEARAPAERLAMDRDGRMVLVKVADVDRFEAEGNYVVAHAGSERYRMRCTVTELEGRLDARRFARVGRGAIVNLDRVAELAPAGHGDYDVKLKDGTWIRMSRRYRDRLDRFR